MEMTAPNEHEIRAPDAPRLLDLLDFEIQQLQIKERNAGLTVWGILVALGGVLWMLSHLLENPLDQVQVARTLVLMFFAIDVVVLLGTLLDPIDETPRLGRFQSADFSILSKAGRIELIVYLVGAGLMIAITTYAWQAPTAAVRLTYLYYGFSIVISIAALIVSCLKLPLAIKPSNNLGQIAVLASVGVACLSISLYSLEMSLTGYPTFAELRTAGLLTVLLVLVRLLAQISQKSPLLYPLIQLRRDFSLGEIDLQTAIRRTETLLNGMRGGDVIRERIRTLFDLQRKLEDTIEVADQEATALLEKKTSPKKEELQNWLKKHSQRTDKIMSELRTANRTFKRIRWVSTTDPDARQVLNKLTASFLKDLGETKIKFQDVRDRIIIKLSEDLKTSANKDKKTDN